MSVCAQWADIGDVCAPCNTYDFPTDLLDDWLLIASDGLYELTRRRWPGECQATIRPCERALCPCRSERCSCRALDQVDLQPHGQVVEVDSVTIDGATLDPARYRLDEGRWLVYIPTGDDDRDGWPRHQRLDRALTEPDTWAIAYTYGAAPPLGGVKAAAALGCQLALSCHPDSSVASRCQLPKAVTNISRQGLTIARPNPAALFPGGITGLSAVDWWVATVNRGAAIRPATVFVPGQAPTYRST
jgi:hypothetical protein